MTICQQALTYCDHLVVRDDYTGEIVGTYRMLSPEGARLAGGLYCETEFLIPSLRGLRGSLVETGRSCVHPDHRTGAVVNLIWAGIARYLLLSLFFNPLIWFCADGGVSA